MKLNELRTSIEDKGLDGFLTCQNARYLADTSAPEAVIVTEDKPILVCGRMEADRARAESRIKEIRAFAKTEIPLRKGEKVFFGEFGEFLAKIIEELNLNVIGHDQIKNSILEKIQENCQADLRKEQEIIQNLRKTKTSEEIKRMKKAGEIASQGMKVAKNIIEAGETEIEIAAEIEYKMRKLGSEGTPFDTIVASGKNSVFPHREATEKKIEKEELVTVDLGARWKGYNSDMTRTFATSPNSKQQKVIDTVKKAQKSALETVEAGVNVKEVDEAAREVFRENDYEEFYLHGVGHGVGLDIHEPPNLSPSSEDVLEGGMVVTIEPGLYIKGTGGCRFEDTVLVKEEGYEKLTDL